ncbi:phosphoribosyltransferase [Anaerosoma tenue]|uniref:phosphoribosyltransferase n=1 Tax=Anaerosoma tenue TaxID=2933588 RepID=UPI002260ECC3|nr:phosphoribosyltransferase family protein [Anaerosoma tenue]MCK8115269.1 phosphoribosyltransferase [Anaerosoma tenue]
MFVDRRDAGRRLAAVLEGRIGHDALVLGIPRGGVIVADEVARALGLELDCEVVRKMGAPGDPEYAIAAVDADGAVVGNATAWADEAYVHRAAEAARVEIARRLATYRKDRPLPLIVGRHVVLVDDGVATGLTVAAAVQSLKRRQASRVTVAAPVASPAAEELLQGMADEVVVVWVDPRFRAVGQYYERFDQTSDDEVIDTLESAWSRG